jgi:hypothetical protein
MSTEPKNVIPIYAAAVEMRNKELEMLWHRFNIHLVVNGGLLVAYLSTLHEGFLASLGIAPHVFGFLLSMLWLCSEWSGRRNLLFFDSRVISIETKMLITEEDAEHYGVLSHMERAPYLNRQSRVSLLVIAVFVLAWPVLLFLDARRVNVAIERMDLRTMDATIITSVVAAGATVVLAVFAGVQIWREFRRDAESRRMADARLGSIGFLLRRQMLAWIGHAQTSSDVFETWIRDAQNRNSFTRELDAAERRITEAANLAPAASQQLARAIRDAYALFFAGAECLNQYVASSRPANHKLMSWFQLRDDAEKDFRDCVRQLESGVIYPGLLEADEIIAAKRFAESPRGKAMAIDTQVRATDSDTSAE